MIATSLLPTGRRSTDFLVAGLAARHGTRWPSSPSTSSPPGAATAGGSSSGAKGRPRTDVAHAVAASCAIPGYFHPVEIDGEMYVDGGVHSPTNADVLDGWDLDVLLVSSPMSVDPARSGRHSTCRCGSVATAMSGVRPAASPPR